MRELSNITGRLINIFSERGYIKLFIVKQFYIFKWI